MENMTRPMNFGEALRVLKAGRKIQREGWNGKGMWLILVNDWTVGSELTEHVVGLFPFSFIAMKTSDNNFVPWLASQTDILSEDWHESN
jgi:hypothetical protein